MLDQQGLAQRTLQNAALLVEAPLAGLAVGLQEVDDVGPNHVADEVLEPGGLEVVVGQAQGVDVGADVEEERVVAVLALLGLFGLKLLEDEV